METHDHQTTPHKSVFAQLQESTGVKLLMIGFLTLILLIPSTWIQSLISERDQRQKEAAAEVAEKWSGPQLIEGPVMQLPYKMTTKITDATGKTSFKEVLSTIYLLPEQLNMTAEVVPQILKRGIFDIVVYNTKIHIDGNFAELELKKSGIAPAMILWDKVKVIAGLTDFKGLKNSPSIKLGDSSYAAEPDFAEENLFAQSLATQLNRADTQHTKLSFSYELALSGSGELNFLHLGKNTNVTMKGDWNNPSFTGNYLPEQRNISTNNFSGSWKMSNFNRPLPQQWVGDQANLKDNKDKAAFGVKFLLPVDQYQKTMRSAKYAILIILLSFIALFFMETFRKTAVGLLQYALIGAAMTIYYCLLLSFTEQLGFNIAYLIASAATILLISIFIAGTLSNKKAAILFAAILSIFYGFIYVIIQLQDMALLFGSIGLFIIVASLMYFSVRINALKEKNT